MHVCQLRVCVCVQLLEGSAEVQHISLFMHSCVSNDGLVFSPKRSMCIPQLASSFLSFFFQLLPWSDRIRVGIYLFMCLVELDFFIFF